jgi:hypothetical protein
MATLRSIWKFIAKWWMKLGHFLGTINATILLSVFYFVLVALYALPVKIYRQFRHQTKPKPAWKDEPDRAETLETLKMQF